MANSSGGGGIDRFEKGWKRGVQFLIQPGTSFEIRKVMEFAVYRLRA